MERLEWEEFEGIWYPKVTPEKMKGLGCCNVGCPSDAGGSLFFGCGPCIYHRDRHKDKEPLISAYLASRAEQGESRLHRKGTASDGPKPKKLAVHCPTEELFDRVSEKLKEEGYDTHSFNWSRFNEGREEPCIGLGWLEEKNAAMADKWFWGRKGYKVVSATEYLIGEESTKGVASQIVAGLDGATYEVTTTFSGDVGVSFDFEGRYATPKITVDSPVDVSLFDHHQRYIDRAIREANFKPKIKLLNTKPESEDKQMKQVNTSIAAVYEKTEDMMLVNDHFCGEVRETFTDELNLRNNKAKYLAEAKKLQKIKDDKAK